MALTTQVVCYINGQCRETTILLIFSPTSVTNSFIHSELRILVYEFLVV